jgi:Family of unknown function (DUF5906)
LEQVDALKTRRANLYFCLSQQAEAKPNGSSRLAAVRNRQNARALKAIWFDIDVKGTDGAKHYPSGRVALAELSKFIAQAGLPHPSAIVASGSGGYHVYWISKSPLTPEEWQRYADGLKAKAQQLGLLADLGCTGDAARVLRVPGTLNYKSNPPKDVVLEGMGEDYDFATALRDLRVEVPSRPGSVSLPSGGLPKIPARFAGKKDVIVVDAADLPPARLINPLPVLQKCAFLRKAFKTGGADYDQPLWHQTIRCASYLEEGNKFAHAFSKGHKTYNYEETEEMWERVLREGKDKDLGWPQCRTIKDNKCKECEGCPFFKEGKSPLNLALRTSKIDDGAVFDQVKQGKLTPVTALMTLRDQGANTNTLLAAMNQTYAVVRYGGQIVVAIIIGDDITFMKVEDFHRMFANLFFDPIDGIIRQLKQRIEQMGSGVVSMTFEDFRDGVADLVGVRRDPKKLSQRWFESKGRRQYLGRGVVFEPGGPLEIPNDMLNLWRGFGIAPKSGDWSLMRAHIFNVVCGGNQEFFEYLINWMAYALQHPDKPIGVAVAFLGPQGAGKGVVARTFGSFFGKHFVHITHGDQLTGRFNASLGTSCAVFLDEALWAGDKKGEGTLKALITEPSFQMEAKFRDPIMVENRLRIMVASNNDWAVPTGVGDRRWFVLNVADTYAGTKHRDYWTARWRLVRTRCR